VLTVIGVPDFLAVIAFDYSPRVNQ
jgi:hypothetical protein